MNAKDQAENDKRRKANGNGMHPGSMRRSSGSLSFRSFTTSMSARPPLSGSTFGPRCWMHWSKPSVQS